MLANSNFTEKKPASKFHREHILTPSKAFQLFLFLFVSFLCVTADEFSGAGELTSLRADNVIYPPCFTRGDLGNLFVGELTFIQLHSVEYK